jgi:hypothetical protein
MGCQLILNNQVVNSAEKRRTKLPIQGMNQYTKSLGWVMLREVLPAMVYSSEELPQNHHQTMINTVDRHFDFYFIFHGRPETVLQLGTQFNKQI